jgi:hypothetical protein
MQLATGVMQYDDINMEGGRFGKDSQPGKKISKLAIIQ